MAEEPFALIFESGGVQLRIQKVEELRPAPYTVFGWQVADINTELKGLGAKGVAFERYDFLEQNESRVWRSTGGAHVACSRTPAEAYFR